MSRASRRRVLAAAPILALAVLTIAPERDIAVPLRPFTIPSAAAHDGHRDERVVRVRNVAGERIAQVLHGDTNASLRTGAHVVGSTRLRARLQQAPALGTDHLSDQLCGAGTPVDDTANAVESLRPKYKVVYAYPSDRASRFDVYGPRIATLVKDSVAFLDASSAGQLTLRVDQGTACGPQFLDVQVVPLPRTYGEYAALGETVFVPLASDVAAAMGPTPQGQRTNVLLFADYVGEVVPFSGQGARWLDDRPGRFNLANEGGSFAIVYGLGAEWFSSALRVSAATTVTHEIFHNLGAVQDSAPHSSGAGHCWDEWDVMCYPDGGPTGGAMAYLCPDEAGSQLLDCGSDDYFALAPGAGTYLAGAWNARDSLFLCAPSRCAAPAQRPVARLAGPASLTAGSLATFDARSSSDADGQIASYAWRVTGAGWLTDLSEAGRATVYGAAPGAVSVEVLVVDDEGIASAPAAQSVVVGAPPAGGGLGDDATSESDDEPTIVTRDHASVSTWWWSTSARGRCRVPRLIGLTAHQAWRRLRRAGCARVKFVGAHSWWRVVGQRPRARTRIRARRTVVVRLARRGASAGSARLSR